MFTWYISRQMEPLQDPGVDHTSAWTLWVFRRTAKDSPNTEPLVMKVRQSLEHRRKPKGCIVDTGTLTGVTTVDDVHPIPLNT